MKVLRLGSYFAPENIAASHLGDDLDELYIKEGITTIYYTPVPSRGISDDVRREYKHKKYEELNDGYLIVHRFSMIKEGTNPIQRAFKYFLCNIAEYAKGINVKDIDLVHSSSTPPTQGTLSAMVAKKLSKKYGRKVPFVYNLQDIFPDSLVNAGMTKEGSFIWKIGRKIENYTYKNSDKIIVISEGFKKNLIAKGVPEEKIEIISNWVDLDGVKPIDKNDNKLFDEFKIDKDKFTVLYAGNFGEVQGGDVIVKAAKKLQNEKDIQFVIFGSGSCFEDIKREARELDNIQVFDLLPEERVPEVYSLGNVALITCKSGTGSAGLPSKTWNIMACNTPIIASFDSNSDLEDVLNKSGAGICVEPENPDELANAVLNEKNNSDRTIIDMRKYALENASKEVCAKKYVNVLLDVWKEAK